MERFTNRDYGTNSADMADIFMSMADMDNVVEALDSLGIQIKDTEGEYRNITGVLRDVMRHWRHSRTPSESRRLGDIAQSMIYALAAEKTVTHDAAEKVTADVLFGISDSGEELDAFLTQFQIH